MSQKIIKKNWNKGILMKIANDSVVSMDYTLFDGAGAILDTSQGRGPLEYIQGKKNIIPGLEKEMDGKEVGDAFKTTIAPAEAYGERDENNVQVIDKSQFATDAELKDGMRFQMQTEQGIQIATVTKIDGDNVTLDTNHPLAGVTLTFDVKIVGIREATDVELAQGHVGEAGGCGDGGCSSCDSSGCGDDEGKGDGDGECGGGCCH